MGRVETSDKYICFIVEKDMLKNSVATSYWGQKNKKWIFPIVYGLTVIWAIQRNQKHEYFG